MNGLPNSCPSVARLLALRRVQRARIVLHDGELFTQDGGRTPHYLDPALRALIAEEHLVLDDLMEGSGRQTVRITQSGVLLHTELAERHTAGALSGG